MDALEPYVALIESFLAQQISPGIFEQRYLRLFLNDKTRWTDQEYEVLNGLFYWVEDYCADESVRTERSTTDQQLQDEAQKALATIRLLPRGQVRAKWSS